MTTATMVALDGSGDFTDLTVAVAQAEPGAILYLAPGEYSVAAGLEIDKPLTLLGSGMEQTSISLGRFQMGGGRQAVLRFNAEGLIAVHDVSIGEAPQKRPRPLRIPSRWKGYWGRVNAIDVRRGEFDIAHCRITGGVFGGPDDRGGDGIEVEGGHGRISHCECVLNEGMGVVVAGDADVTLSHCVIDANGGSGASILGHATVTIANNYITRNGLCGISAWSHRRVTISDNVCERNRSTGIAIYWSTEASITDNIARRNGGCGISLSSYCNSTLEYNRCDGNGLDVINYSSNCGDSIARKNSCIQNRLSGIYIDDGSAPLLEHNYLHDNLGSDVNDRRAAARQS